MKTNKQSKIKVKQSKYNRSKFNWTHDVNTTFSWGEIQPTQCKMLIPGSKTTMSTQNLIRLSPMVAPTFGRVKYKTFNQYVAISEIFPNFDAMMAQEPKSTAFGTKVPQKIPHVPLGKLSAYVLMGARATLYWVDRTLSATAARTAAQRGHYKTEYKTVNNLGVISYPTEASTVLSDLTAQGCIVNGTNVLNNFSDTGSTGTGTTDNVIFRPALTDSAWYNLYYDDANNGHGSEIYLSNEVVGQLIPFDRGTDQQVLKQYFNAATKEVTLESADYVIEFAFQDGNGVDRYYALALECSDYGKRIRKVLQGCGYQIDFASEQMVSILPLLAQYKAYFDVFGLTLYQGWETTRAAKLIKWIENEFIENIDTYNNSRTLPCEAANALSDNEKLFGNFMLHEVADEWYTEDADFVGANMEKLAVSPNYQLNNGSFISWDTNGITNPNIDQLGVSTDGIFDGQTEDIGPLGTTIQSSNSKVQGHASINNVYHNELDAELLKRLYKWTNRNTVLGRQIAKLMKAQGLGDYLDSCKSNFIGSTDTLITISDVISTADTSNGNNGAVLGEYGGRGLQYDATGTLVFENDEYGYWITLATIIPEAGYTQGLDPTLTCQDVTSLYLPDFDAMGMEATQKNTIVGNRYICNWDKTLCDNAHETFGFIPRMSKFKIAQNLVNGDFNRHNMRNTYLPYTLDKQLNINDYESAYENYDPTGTYSINDIIIRRSITNTDMPVAGNAWRTPTKFNFLGNFDRIFYKNFDDGRSISTDWLNYQPAQTLIGFNTWNDDNFMCHSIYDVNCYAPMKPIEESYGLEEDSPNNGGSDFVSKA